MQIVNVKENCPPAVERNGTLPASAGRRRPAAARRRQLRLFIATGPDALKELNGTGLAVDPQLKVLAAQVIDKSSLPIEDHDIGLDQLSPDAHDIALIARRQLRGLRWRGGKPECQQEKNCCWRGDDNFMWCGHNTR